MPEPDPRARSALTSRTPTKTAPSTSKTYVASIVTCDETDITPISSRPKPNKRPRADYGDDKLCSDNLSSDVNAVYMLQKENAANIQFLVRENAELKAKLNVVIDLLHEFIPKRTTTAHAATKPTVASFANVLKIGKPVLIKPKSPKSSDATKKLISDKLNPVDYGLSSVKSLQNGSLVINCTSSAERNKLLSNAAAQLGDKCNASIPVCKRRVRIFGLSQQADESFVQTLKKQNSEILSGALLLNRVHSFANKIKSRFGVILEVDDTTYKKLIAAEKVFVDWSICSVYEDLNIRRCFKCWGFNHIAAKCQSLVKRCSKCCENHNFSECTSSQLKCAACIDASSTLRLDLDVNHAATSQECPTYLHRVDVARQAVNYAT